MKILPRQSERGIAIIIVMISIFVLAMLAGAFAYSMKVETRLATYSDNETQLQWAGRSGIDKARCLLSLTLTLPGSGQRYDALDQTWAGGSGDTNEVLANFPRENIEIAPGVVIKKYLITDTERKFNINMAITSPDVLQKALILAGAEAADIPIIIPSVQDWIDSDNDARINGAESDYYQTLDPPYFAKNGPIDEISELLLIKGITPDLYWGADAPSHPPPIFQRQIVTRSGMQPVSTGPPVRLVDIFTPVSSGQINLLTASATQLQVLPGVDENVAAEIIQLRQEAGGDSFLPYNNPADLLINTSLGRNLAPVVAPYCTFRSSTFEVTVVVEVGMVTRTYFALVRRNTPRDIPILNMRWEDGDQSGEAEPPQ